MDLVNISVILSAIIIIVVLWFIVAARHLKGKLFLIKEQWEFSDAGLRKRQNLIPNVIETLKIYDKTQEEFIAILIKDRLKAAKEIEFGTKKIECEHILSHHINKIFGISGTNNNLASDTNFLELKKEIKDLNHNIDEKVIKFNNMVRDYNKDLKLFYLKPIAFLKRHKKINIFEFEL